MKSSGNDVVVISSLVSRGGVGARATAFALERLGFRVWLVPTITLPHHPGQGAVSPIAPTGEAFATLLDGLARDDWLAGVRGIVTGYFSFAEQIGQARSFIDRARTISPNLTYLCDPVIGDMAEHGGSRDARGRLYVPEGVAASIADQLMPRADIATPNFFEAGWLTGEGTEDFAALAEAARRLGPNNLLITGVPGMMRGTIATSLIEDNRLFIAENRHVECSLKGTGDVLSGLYLGHLLKGQTNLNALKLAAAGTYEALSRSHSLGLDELDLPGAQEALVRPRTQIAVREMKLAQRPKDLTRKRSGGLGMGDRWVAGVDGCKGGWVVVFRPLFNGAAPRIGVFEHFKDILDAPEDPAIIAVDMPIGLPDQCGPGGRGPESIIRPMLGERQSSVFSIPSRKAVFCEDYRQACAAALETSDPPRKVSKQAFNLFPKIRELDALLSEDNTNRVFEVHPELAFWRLNGEQPARLPKKIKSRANSEGLNERRTILTSHGFDDTFLRQKPPRGVGADDLLDAAVSAVIAGRIWNGLARPFPSNPVRDSRGLPIAIWS